MSLGLVNDLKSAFRSIYRHSVFSGFVILVLALGVTAVTSLFSIFDALLLRPLPVREPETLVRIVRVRPGMSPLTDFRYGVYLALQKAQNLEDICAIYDWSDTYIDGEIPERIRVEAVSQGCFALFGVAPQLGRTPSPEETNSQSLLLSHAFWRRHYSEDRAVLNRKVLVQGRPFLVLGVLPGGFHGVTADISPDVWVSMSAIPWLFSTEKTTVRLDDLWYEIIARRKSTADPAAARDEAYGLFRAAMDEVIGQHPDAAGQIQENELAGRLQLEPIGRGDSRLRSQVSSYAMFSLAGAGILLIMIGANVSALSAARWVAREGELAVRLALGASPGQVCRLAILETLLLVCFGALVGFICSGAMMPLLLRMLPPVQLLDASIVPLSLDAGFDYRVFAFAILVIFVMASVVSLFPALQALRTDTHSLLRAARSFRTPRGNLLVMTSQIAVCTLLIIAAVFLTETLRRLQSTDPGFAQDRVLTFTLDLEAGLGGKNQPTSIIDRFLQGVQQLPGVRGVGLAGRPLMRGTGLRMTVAPAGEATRPGEFMNTSVNYVSAEYFDTLGLRLLEGRTFTHAEAQNESGIEHARAVLVNQAFARWFFPNGSAVGKAFGTAGGEVAKPQFLIVGIVSDAKYRSLREPLQPIVYLPFMVSDSTREVIVYVRSATSPSAMIVPIRGLLHSIAPDVPMFDVTTLQQAVGKSLWRERIAADLSVAFACLAAMVASISIGALLSFVVGKRTGEIAVRVALGATRNGVLRLILWQVFPFILMGLLGGIGASFYIIRVIQALLYGVSYSEPAPFLVATLLVIFTGFAGTLLPALRALQIQPATALRHE